MVTKAHAGVGAYIGETVRGRGGENKMKSYRLEHACSAKIPLAAAQCD